VRTSLKIKTRVTSRPTFYKMIEWPSNWKIGCLFLVVFVFSGTQAEGIYEGRQLDDGFDHLKPGPPRPVRDKIFQQAKGR